MRNFEAYQNLIGGVSSSAQDGRTVDAVCPSDGRAFASMPRSGAAEVDAAVKAARSASSQ